MKSPIILLAAIALASCAPPKAIVIAEAPKKPAPTAPPTPEKITLAGDGLRLPDMLTLPDDNQLRSATPLKKEGDATITTSPPIE